MSGIWSVAVDAGIGGGALGMGPVGAAIGLTHAFWLLPALFALAFVLRLPEPTPNQLASDSWPWSGGSSEA